MIISLNWLKKFTSINLPLHELTMHIGERLVEIEDVVDLTEKYRDVIVVRVVTCEPVPDSDHLNLTTIDDGGTVADVERNEAGYVQVVCGANNVRVGMLAAWLPPRSVVPETYGHAEPFVLGARKLRGFMSNGMLASARELELYDDHEGILDIDVEAHPGSRFADVYELNDQLLHIENKSLTHRPDTFGIVGFAREVAGIQGVGFETPLWLRETNPTHSSVDSNTSLNVHIDDISLAGRYQAIMLSDVDSARRSPIQIQTYLARAGVRPISGVVDATNYMMLLTGQPLHAFDYDKVVALTGGDAHIHVRGGRDSETLELLDGRTVQLSSDDIVIAAGETAIALGGAMGGASTAIDNTTKTIILESASFNLYKLRTTQMRHGIFSEAITRFTKGPSAELTAPVLAEAIRLMSEWTGAQPLGTVRNAYPTPSERPLITLSLEYINAVLGHNYSEESVISTLENVELKITGQDGRMAIDVPYWRTDIHTPEDVIEEVGRLSGYDSIAPILPARDFRAVVPDSLDQFKSKLRPILSACGGNEVLTYSFVHSDTLAKAGQDPDNSYRLTNSISPSLQCYRQSLMPSLLSLVHPNIKSGFDEFALFELNKVHDKASGLTDENVPVEHHNLAMVTARKKSHEGSPYYQAKSLLEYLGFRLGLTFGYEPLGGDSTAPITSPYMTKRAAIVIDKKTGDYLGVIGEYRKAVVTNFKLPDYCAGFELDTEALFRAFTQVGHRYEALSRFPGIERDMSLRVASDVSYGDIITSMYAELAHSSLDHEVRPVSVYQPEDETVKTVTVRIALGSRDRTLTSEEVSQLLGKVAERMGHDVGAKVM